MKNNLFSTVMHFFGSKKNCSTQHRDLDPHTELAKEVSDVIVAHAKFLKYQERIPDREHLFLMICTYHLLMQAISPKEKMEKTIDVYYKELMKSVKIDVSLLEKSYNAYLKLNNKHYPNPTESFVKDLGMLYSDLCIDNPERDIKKFTKMNPSDFMKMSAMGNEIYISCLESFLKIKTKWLKD